MEMWLCRITTQTTKTFIQYVLFTFTWTLQPITWPYHMTLVQTFFTSLNRYLVVTESKLNDLLWNGKRKYIVFCVMWVVLFILNSSMLSFVLHGCNINSYTWQRNICSYVWFSSSLNSKSDDYPLRCNFVEDIQGTQKDGLQHGGDRWQYTKTYSHEKKNGKIYEGG